MIQSNLPVLQKEGWMIRLGRRSVEDLLNRIHTGMITLRDARSEKTFGGPADLAVRITVKDSRFYRDLLLRGTLGAGESYADGFWEVDDLPSLIRLFVRNRDVLDDMDKGTARLALPALRMVHRFNRNTEEGSRRNIEAHYDLGNTFFQTFLDDTMMYSAAVFDHPGQDLADASRAKLERICRKLDLKASDHLLEIGTGWGGMAVYAAEHYGCRVTTTTISRQQYEHAVALVRARGLEDRVTVLEQDYRTLTGQYDKLVSIEMIEAVGHEFLGTYFETCSHLLKADGRMVIQAILMNAQEYPKYLRSVDFIRRYIFPGSCCPSIDAILSAVAKDSDLRCTGLEDMTPHYAETLRRWRASFLSSDAEIAEMGFPEEFRRLWDFYFAYCEGGFEERYIGSVQLTFAKPLERSVETTFAPAPTGGYE
jgi:cyclopropane-fatty-acyl-phospholipid synthase